MYVDYILLWGSIRFWGIFLSLNLFKFVERLFEMEKSDYFEVKEFIISNFNCLINFFFDGENLVVCGLV